MSSSRPAAGQSDLKEQSPSQPAVPSSIITHPNDAASLHECGWFPRELDSDGVDVVALLAPLARTPMLAMEHVVALLALQLVPLLAMLGALIRPNGPQTELLPVTPHQKPMGCDATHRVHVDLWRDSTALSHHYFLRFLHKPPPQPPPHVCRLLIS